MTVVVAGAALGTSWLDRALFRAACLGALVFVVGSAIGMWLYPGGNHFDRAHVGYDVADNYLCDTFRARAYDGSTNTRGAAFGQAGMIGLVVAASAMLFAAPGTFRERMPRLARGTRVVAAVAFVGMMLVPLTPAHEYGMLHFAAVGVASIPSLLAALAVAWGIMATTRNGSSRDLCVRRVTVAAILACTFHFGQYMAQVAHVLGESPSVPRAQKIVVSLVILWVVVVARWALARDRAGTFQRRSANQ